MRITIETMLSKAIFMSVGKIAKPIKQVKNVPNNKPKTRIGLNKLNTTFRRFNSTSSKPSNNHLLRSGRFPSRMNMGINFFSSGSKYVVERFGKFSKVEDPGLCFLVPFIDRISYVVDERELCFRIDPETAMTEDNVAVTLGGNLYVQFYDAYKGAYGASNPLYAITQFAQAVMRTSVGGYKLDKLFSERTQLNSKVRSELEEGAKQWGCKVIRFEITDLEALDKNVSQALHKQSTAERERREKITQAEANKRQTELNADAYKYEKKAQAEGDAEKVRLDADANAYKILKQAEAERDAIRIVTEAISQPGGMDTIKMKLSEKYFESLKQLGGRSTIVVPSNLSDITSMIAAGQAVFNSTATVNEVKPNASK